MNDKRPTMRLLYGAPTIRRGTSDDKTEKKPDPGAVKRPERPGRKPYPEFFEEKETDPNETVDVYAGPGMMGETGGEYPDPSDEEESPRRTPRMNKVYAGPGMMGTRRPAAEAVYAAPGFNKKAKRTETAAVYAGPEYFGIDEGDRTPVEAVYAGPDYFGEESGTDPTPIAPVYAGPEYFGIGDKDKEKAAFEGVYAGPEPQQPSMMLVYAGPEYFANRPIGGPADFPAPDVRFCPRCGAMNKQNAKFCTECGTVLQPEEPQPEPEAKRFYCHECGAAVAEDMPACPCCGAKRDVPGETKVFEAVREPEKPAAPVKRGFLRRLFAKRTGIDREEK